MAAQSFTLKQPAWAGWWTGSVALLVAVFVVYQPVWFAGYVWDDDTVLTANPCIVGPLGLKEIWTTDAADICPLTLTTFWLEHALWGVAPLPYHLVNVLWHAAGAILLWRVLRALKIPGAWLGAALWAVHPVQVESVAWIAEMKNTESGVFYLLTILFFLRGLKEKMGGNYCLSLLFAVMAMASKSSTVVLPLVLLLGVGWIEGRVRLVQVLKVVPMFLLSIAAGLVSIWTQKHNGADSLHDVPSWPQRLITAGDAAWFYLGKLVWPHSLMVVYPRWQIDAGRLLSYAPLLAGMMVLAAFWRGRKSWSRPGLWAGAYFLVALLPVLGLMKMSFQGHSFVADHFQYLADMGPLALIGAGISRLAGLQNRRRWEIYLGGALVLLLGVISWQRVWVFQDEETLWSDVLAKNPDSWAGHLAVGKVFLEKGEIDDAIRHYQQALALNSYSVDVRYSLGVAYMNKGMDKDALDQFQEAIHLQPDYANPYNNIGTILLKMGRVNEAIGYLEKAIELLPGYGIAHINLGTAFLAKGEPAQALAEAQKAIEIDPQNADAYYTAGCALTLEKQPVAAVAEFQKTLELRPGFRAAQSRLDDLKSSDRRFSP